MILEVEKQAEKMKKKSSWKKKNKQTKKKQIEKATKRKEMQMDKTIFFAFWMCFSFAFVFL